MDRDLLELVFNVGGFLVLITVGYVVGSYLEKRHYASIREREAHFLRLPAVPMSLETALGEDGTDRIDRAEMVMGTVVLSEDFFKACLAGIQSLFGGNLTSYESLLDRARREAVLRMKSKAPYADIIVNLRLENISIGKEGGTQGKEAKSVEMMAYGTAITFRK